MKCAFRFVETYPVLALAIPSIQRIGDIAAKSRAEFACTRKIRRNFTARFFLALFFFVLTACGRAPLYRQESFVFGTRVEILIAGQDEASARQAASTVLAEFDRLHRQFHAWRPSELTALNTALAARQSYTVSAELAGLLRDTQELSRRGDGLFDPGIGALVQLWGFQSEDYKAALPDPAAIARWRSEQPGVADLQFDGLRASSRKRQLAIDLGGYLKGVALDRAAQMLRARGVNNALINIGGNVMALGTKNGEAWRVGIQHPRQPGALATLALHDGEAIGTSGDYQRYFEVNGQRYCHLLDPRSGAPVQHTQALTVLITPQTAAGALSDMASKPLFIIGPDWPALAQRLGVKHVMRIDAAGRLQVSESLFRRLEFSEKQASTMQLIPL